MSEPIRLQRYLAQAGIASRRSSEELITSGRVSVNGVRVDKLGSKVTPGEDIVALDGREVRFEKKVLYRFHKPRGVVSTLRDPHAERTLQDFLGGIAERVYPVGRLDADVSGLLLLTNDGDFAEKLLHPRYEIERVYVARVRGVIDEIAIAQLEQGVSIDGSEHKSAAAQILSPSPELATLLGNSEEGESFVEIRVHEGAKHFVKKLLQAVSFPVVRLSRIAFGEFILGDLPEGLLNRVEFPKGLRDS